MRAVLLAAVAALALSVSLQSAEAVKLVTLCRPNVTAAGVDQTTVMNQWVASVTKMYGSRYANFSLARDHDISVLDLGVTQSVFISGRPCERAFVP